MINPSTVNHGFAYNGVNLNSSYQAPLSGSYQYVYDKDRRLIHNIRVSETTHSLVKNQGFVFRELDKIRVMGKENPVTIFELIEEQTRVSSNVRQELESHRKALAAYYAGKFETAHKSFKQLAGGPHGTLYQLYMKRCRAYLKNPPPQPWNGITTLKTK